MRIHTDLTMAQIYQAMRDSGTSGVYFDVLTQHKSSSHARAFEIRLEGNGTRTNSGQYGAGDGQAATWDEWGAIMGQIFKADPEARMGGTAKRPVYANADDFHWQTGERFEDGLPKDTHKRHAWEHAGQYATNATIRTCKRCTALQRWAV